MIDRYDRSTVTGAYVQSLFYYRTTDRYDTIDRYDNRLQAYSRQPTVDSLQATSLLQSTAYTPEQQLEPTTV